MLAIVPVKSSELKTSFSLLKKKNWQIEEGLKTYYHETTPFSFLSTEGWKDNHHMGLLFNVGSLYHQKPSCPKGCTCYTWKNVALEIGLYHLKNGPGFQP